MPVIILSIGVRFYTTEDRIAQRCTTFLGQGPQCITFSALEVRKQNYDLNFRKSSVKKRKEN